MLTILKKKDKYIKVFSEYFLCEAFGEDMECVRDNFHQFESDLYEFSVSFILFSSLSYMYFIIFLIMAFVLRKVKYKDQKLLLHLAIFNIFS